jgi:hypothetical protein
VNKFFLVLAGLLVFFPAFGFAFSFEPQAPYPGMKVHLNLEGKKVSVVQVLGKITEEGVFTCSEVSCPVFENKKTEFHPKNSSVVLLTKGVEPGNYLLKFSFKDSSVQPVYSTLIVQADYRPAVALITMLLLGLLFWVERNEKRVK